MTHEDATASGVALAPVVTFDANGLVPVVAQDEASGDVLLLAYMNAEALRRTLAEGVLTLWSRSRGRLWRKGEQSGHMLRVSELRVNCESNSVLARVRLEGPGACHEGYRTCYYRKLEAEANETFTATVVEERVFDPAAVYGASASSDAMDGEDARAMAAFEENTRELYAAYERLRDGDEIPTSGTSRLLHERDREAVARRARARGAQELAELRGVLAGSHRHRGGADDVLLEASQVGYWALLAAIARNIAYDAWTPHTAWLAGYRADDDASATSCSHDAQLLGACSALLRAAGALCRQGGVHPADVIAADLAAIRAKHPPAR